ncbi:hypothetical protein ZIOFF_041086 [Zingiber officinale]|uniref:Uncharacterized protein n=1 Tax=Zingiber officinale TaxID=94328 RepID=A0A8J5G728_ZINOF|nr:hypothetical protein ZIOFF_041086 [Zingiber officinale]
MKRKAVDEDGHYAGAGGKLTRKELRTRIALTPYDLPELTGRSRGFGWISAPPSPTVFSPKFSVSALIQDPWPSTSKALPQSMQEDNDRPSSSRNAFGKLISFMQDIDAELAGLSYKEQSNYLKELLQSRTRDFDCHGETEGILNQKVSIKSQSTVLPGHLLTPKPEEYLKMKVVILNSRILFGLDMSLLTDWLLMLVNDVSSSAVEIAKAYMEGLVTESFHEPRKSGLKNMTADNNALASEIACSSVIRSPVCWPGAIVENNETHLTLKTSRSKVEPFSSRRAPYSGSIFSKAKFQDGGERRRTQTVSSFGWKESSTALSGITVPPKYDASTPSKELLDSNLAIFSSTPSSIPNAMKNLSSTWKANYVPPKSSQAAMKILEHLNKTIPSPKEKLIHANPEVLEIKSFSNFATDCHAKKPADDEEAKASLFSKGVGKEENFFEEKVKSSERILPLSQKFEEILLLKDLKECLCPDVGLCGVVLNLGPLVTWLTWTWLIHIELDILSFAVAMPTMSKDDNAVLLSATPTPMTKDHKLPGANKKSYDAAIKVAVSGSTPLNASSKTPSMPVLTSSSTYVPFKFPVSSSTSLIASLEPPAMPASTSPAMSTMPTSAANNMPSFIFSSPCPNSGLNFSLATTSNPTVTDTPEPQFKFGSGDQRSLSFWFRNTESALY